MSASTRSHEDKLDAGRRLAGYVATVAGVPLHTFLREPLWRDKRLKFFGSLVSRGWTPGEIAAQWGSLAAEGLAAPATLSRAVPPAPPSGTTLAAAPKPSPVSESRQRAPFLSSGPSPAPAPPPLRPHNGSARPRTSRPARLTDADGILAALARGPMAISALAELLGVKEPLVGLFLARLRKEGKVARGEGQNAEWSLADAEEDEDEESAPAVLDEDDEEPAIDIEHAGSPDLDAVDVPDDETADETVVREEAVSRTRHRRPAEPRRHDPGQKIGHRPQNGATLARGAPAETPAVRPAPGPALTREDFAQPIAEAPPDETLDLFGRRTAYLREPNPRAPAAEARPAAPAAAPRATGKTPRKAARAAPKAHTEAKMMAPALAHPRIGEHGPHVDAMIAKRDEFLAKARTLDAAIAMFIPSPS